MIFIAFAISSLIGLAMLADKGTKGNELIAWVIVVIFFCGLIGGLIVRLGWESVLAIATAVLMTGQFFWAINYLTKRRNEGVNAKIYRDKEEVLNQIREKLTETTKRNEKIK